MVLNLKKEELNITIENNTTDDTIEKPDLFQIKEKIDQNFLKYVYMSDEDIKEKITSKKRDITREEELERGKVWNIMTQRYRSKIATEQAYKSRLLYLVPLNCYLDYSKVKTRCFHPPDEIRSGIVWYVNGKHYTYRFKPDKEKKLNFTYHPGTNTYTTPLVVVKVLQPLD